MKLTGLTKLAFFWVPRWKFKMLPTDKEKADKIYNSPDFIASEKKDGTLIFGEIQDDRHMHLIARNKSVNGNYIDRTDYAPQVSSKTYPASLIGTKVIGELYHPGGFTSTSRILNSTPANAQKLQMDIGNLKYMPFDIYAYKGKTLEGVPYRDRLKILEKFVKEVKSDDIHAPNYRFSNKKEFADKIKAQGKEGVVLVDANAPLFGGDWYKDKKRVDYDLRIIGVTPGTGKYVGNGIGAFIVEDASGKYRAKVGIGIDDRTRRDAYNHSNRYIGRIAKVEALELTKNSLRHPKFLGLEDKTEPDTIN